MPMEIILNEKSYVSSIFKKSVLKLLDCTVYSDIKFHESPSSGSRTIACRRTVRHDEANIHVLQFCDLA